MAAWSCAGRSGAARRAAAPQPTATTPSRPAGRKGRRKRGRGLCCSERAPQPPAGRGGEKPTERSKCSAMGTGRAPGHASPLGVQHSPPQPPILLTERHRQAENNVNFFFFFLYTEYRKVSVKSKTLQLLCTVELAGLLGGGVAYKQKRQRGVTTNELLQ